MSLPYALSPPPKHSSSSDLLEYQELSSTTWMMADAAVSNSEIFNSPFSSSATREPLQQSSPTTSALSYFCSDATLDENMFRQLRCERDNASLSPSHLHISQIENTHLDPHLDSPWMMPLFHHPQYEANTQFCMEFTPTAAPEYYTFADSTLSHEISSYSTTHNTENTSDTPWSLAPEASLGISETLSQRQPSNYSSDDSDDASCDKPYARLIYEALLHAPGHRMMLREIYDWFKINTTKPRESGTNGWQNSIRHNLSMNKAFENDRSDSRNPKGPARKANSMWILTEEAIRNGVQSTTRYRKTGSAKKSTLNRVPALQRQRSGAKGGRAARRAARLRRQEQTAPCKYPSPLISNSAMFENRLPLPSSFTDYSTVCSPSPLTPSSDERPHTPPLLDGNYSHFPDSLPCIKSETEGSTGDSLYFQGLIFQPTFDPGLGEGLRLQMESVTSEMMI